MFKIAIFGLGVLALIFIFFGWFFAAPAYVGPLSDHFNGQQFHNDSPRQNGLINFLTWISRRKPGPWPDTVANKVYPHPPRRVSGEYFNITFINHSTVLIQIDGLNILTDPIWSQRCSPLSFIGPKRVREPGLSFDDLPPIDVVLISHNHYDHLDLSTLKRLWLRDKPRIVSGLGNNALLTKNGMSSVDVDWWQSLKLSEELTLWSVPAQHFSNRGLTDRNKTLWMGFVIEGLDAKIYFAGDTGFSPYFEQIYQRFGSMDLALLPIGAFVPTWFMRYAHISPREALEAARILKAHHSIGIHFGTFALADDAEDEPARELARAKDDIGGNLHTLDFGQSEQLLKAHPARTSSKSMGL